MSLKRFVAAVAGSFATLALCTQPPHGQDQSLYSETAPATIFSGGAQYLIMSRDTKLSSATRVVNGPDSALTGFGNLDFQYQSGFRAFLAAETDGVKMEAIYSHYGKLARYEPGQLDSGTGLRQRNSWSVGRSKFTQSINVLFSACIRIDAFARWRSR